MVRDKLGGRACGAPCVGVAGHLDHLSATTGGAACAAVLVGVGGVTWRVSLALGHACLHAACWLEKSSPAHVAAQAQACSVCFADEADLRLGLRLGTSDKKNMGDYTPPLTAHS